MHGAHTESSFPTFLLFLLFYFRLNPDIGQSLISVVLSRARKGCRALRCQNQNDHVVALPEHLCHLTFPSYHKLSLSLPCWILTVRVLLFNELLWLILPSVLFINAGGERKKVATLITKLYKTVREPKKEGNFR